MFTSVQGLEGGIMYIHSRFSGEMREPEGMLFPVFRLQKILSPLYCVIFLGPAPIAGGWPRMLGEPCSPGDRPRRRPSPPCQGKMPVVGETRLPTYKRK